MDEYGWPPLHSATSASILTKDLFGDLLRYRFPFYIRKTWAMAILSATSKLRAMLSAHDAIRYLEHLPAKRPSKKIMLEQKVRPPSLKGRSALRTDSPYDRA